MNSPSETLRASITDILMGEDEIERHRHYYEPRADEILTLILNKLPEKKPIATSPSDDSEGDAYLDGFHEGYNAALDDIRQILEEK